MPNAHDAALRGFGEATRKWFMSAVGSPSSIQQEGWPPVQRGEHALLLAPTGSGKTLAAFLACIDQLLHSPAPQTAPRGPRVLYISPLKALAYDIERNLRVPLRDIPTFSKSPLAPVSIDVRTGDTSPSARRRQRRAPGDILITTPESLYLLLGSQAREALRTVETVIVDEIHAVANNKRGAHLALSLERLDRLCQRDVQRVGLSATQRPLKRIARLLGGDRPVCIVDCASPPQLQLEIVMPTALVAVDDEERATTASPKPDAEIVAHLLDLIRRHKTTLIFCNNRRLAERMAQEINDHSGQPLCRAHHGSVARKQRETIEAQLKRGDLRALVATSSLELGVDMSSVDLVVQIASPHSIAQGLQRVGRAGHRVGVQSRGIIIPKFPGDLLQSAVIGNGMRAGDIEESRVPKNCLDVLAQQIVAMCSVEELETRELFDLVRRSSPFEELSESVFSAVLDMLSGRYFDDGIAELRPRIVWDRQEDLLSARRGSKMLSLINGGTIPDRGLYAVHLRAGGPRIGELDEEMVYEARVGETFFLGASTWRILEITRDQVIVAPAPGEDGKMPFWRGEGVGRPAALGRAIGAFCRAFSTGDDDRSVQRLTSDYKLDDNAAEILTTYLRQQKAATKTVPNDRTLVGEKFRDEVGDWRLCILSPFGTPVHAPWAMLIDARLKAEGLMETQPHWTDDGIALRLPDTGRKPELDLFTPSPEEVGARLIEELANSALFAARFRENAARSLLLPRNRPGKRTPLWLQRLKAQQLLTALQTHPNFPIVVETYRECMEDIFDVPALTRLLADIQSGDIRVEMVETPAPSPFARNLVFSYVAAFLYQGDTPAAERSAQALRLAPSLLRELLGTENFRSFLDLDSLQRTERELQRLSSDRKARDENELHDLLRQLGALSTSEADARCTTPCRPWLESLRAQARVCNLSVAGEKRWIATEDASKYRDGLAISLPAGIPANLLATVPDALHQLVLRFAARRAPFTARELSETLGISTDSTHQVLHLLVARGRLQCGAMTPGRIGEEWCHPEVLRKIRRKSLQAARDAIAPVPVTTYASYLCHHHGISKPGHGVAALRTAIERLGGLAYPWSDLESRILPARVADYHPDMLDSLCASGEVLWMGAGTLGKSNGKIQLVLRQHASTLLDYPTPLPADAPDLAKQIDAELIERGASFLVSLDLPQTVLGAEVLDEALAYLLWRGRITNDTLAFLRGMGSRPRAARAVIKLRLQRRAGRWSTTEGVSGGSEPTRAALVRTHAALDCFAVISRDLRGMLGESYTEIANTLRIMEERGNAHSGLFVEELEGKQYALAGTVDRLRQPPPTDGQILAASDPANPWGAAFAWPRGIGARRAGAVLLLWQGHPVCFLETGKSTLFTYTREEPLDHVLHTLLPQLATRRTLRIRRIDDEHASKSPLRPRFEAHEFRAEQNALVLERYR